MESKHLFSVCVSAQVNHAGLGACCAGSRGNFKATLYRVCCVYIAKAPFVFSASGTVEVFRDYLSPIEASGESEQSHFGVVFLFYLYVTD